MKRFIATLMSLCLVLGMMCVPAFAADSNPVVPSVTDSFTVTQSGASGTVPVQLTTVGQNIYPGGGSGVLLAFKVALPTALPAYVDSHNLVYTANNATIVNLSAGPVEVTNLGLYSANGWTITDYDKDLRSLPVGEKTVAVSINGLKSISGSQSNHINYDQSMFMSAFRAQSGTSYLWAADYNPYTGISTPVANGSMHINYDVKTAPQNRAMNAETVSQAVFTVAFVYA